MNKIASSLELQGELQRIQRIAREPNPSRVLLARELQSLAARLVPNDNRTASDQAKINETSAGYVLDKVSEVTETLSKASKSLEGVVTDNAMVMSEEGFSSEAQSLVLRGLTTTLRLLKESTQDVESMNTKIKHMKMP